MGVINNMINKEIYQQIFDKIELFVPTNWEKIIIYLEYGEASYSFSFFYNDGDKYIKCYDIPSISEDKLYEAFKELNTIVSAERIKGDLWSNMTMVVDRESNIKAYFDYTDFSSGNFEYMEKWKKKYLI